MHALLYIASALTGLWGTAHLFATRGVVAGFGELSFTLAAVLIAPGAWL